MRGLSHHERDVHSGGISYDIGRNIWGNAGLFGGNALDDGMAGTFGNSPNMFPSMGIHPSGYCCPEPFTDLGGSADSKYSQSAVRAGMLANVNKASWLSI